MTKSLTELWKDVELPSGFYYASIPGAVCGASILDEYELQAYKSVRDSDKIEVLSEVPSYSEYQALKYNCELTHTRLKGAHQKITQLEKKLAIAIEALKEIEKNGTRNDIQTITNLCVQNWLQAHKALKEMEEV